MDYKAKIGQNIRNIRKQLDWTIDILAEKADLSSNFVGNIERGNGVASIQSLIKIIEALGCSASDVFKGVINEKGELDPDTSVYIKNLVSEMSRLNENQQKSLYKIFKIYMDDLKNRNE